MLSHIKPENAELDLPKQEHVSVQLFALRIGGNACLGAFVIAVTAAVGEGGGMVYLDERAEDGVPESLRGLPACQEPRLFDNARRDHCRYTPPFMAPWLARHIRTLGSSCAEGSAVACSRRNGVEMAEACTTMCFREGTPTR